MLQTMLVTGVTPLQIKDEINDWENRPFNGVWPESNNRKSDLTRNRTIKKKNKRVRTAFTTDQIRTLEKTFLKNRYINSDNRRELSKQLKIDDKCIKIWFQNKRMKEKRESSEYSDSSSENAREAMSPPLAKPEPELDTNTGSIQYNHQIPYNYYQHQAFYTGSVNAHDQVYEAPNCYNANDITGMYFCNETNPYPTQYYPSGDSHCFYQNQYYYPTNDSYNWCNENTGSYNYDI